MGSSPSQTSIVNAAAALCESTQRISSIEDPGGLGIAARAHWDELVREALAMHPWAFATKRAVLNEGAAPAHGTLMAYQLPADCLRWIPPVRGDENWYEGFEEGGRILTDAEAPLPVRYVSADWTTKINQWPPLFVAAITASLAELLAGPLTQSATMARAMEDRAARAWAKAKRTNNQTQGNRDRARAIANSRWGGARRHPFRDLG